MYVYIIKKAVIFPKQGERYSYIYIYIYIHVTPAWEKTVVFQLSHSSAWQKVRFVKIFLIFALES